jgi:FKBP-type peptidyl-prolyl cis-trans isomerase
MLAMACNHAVEQTNVSENVPQEDAVMEYNQKIVEAESQAMDDFIRRYHWNMQKTNTGLRYMIYQKGNGPEALDHSVVEIRYTLSLLNGDTLYRADNASTYSFETGKRSVISGLEEGVMLMNQGSRAKLIVPSHLAFGLLGDMEKVPTQAVLVYDVELCNITPVKK